MPALAPSTKEQIVYTAERLFAEHGIGGVSLRQIGAAAGSGNNSAVQYHFGSKDKLIQAIFEHRLPLLHERRTLLIAERCPRDLRAWLECRFRALLEQSEREGSHYVRFVAMLQQQGRRDIFERLPAEFLASARTFHEKISALLPHVVEPLRSHRIAQALMLLVHAGADRERARAGGRKVLPFAVYANDLLDGIAGFLEAPVSPAARLALDEADPADVSWPPFL